jgi:hypothetical protein
LKEGKVSESGGGSEEDLAGFETSLEANRTCAGGTGSTEGGFGAEVGKGLDIEKFLPFTSVLTEIV